MVTKGQGRSSRSKTSEAPASEPSNVGGNGCRLSAKMGYVGEEDKKRSAKNWQAKRNSLAQTKRTRGTDETTTLVNRSTNSLVGESNASGTSSKQTPTYSFVERSKQMNARAPTVTPSGMNMQIEVPTTTFAMDIDENTTSVGNFSAGNIWKFAKSSGGWEDEEIDLTIAKYVKQSIFPHIKFIPSPSWLMYNTKERSICGQVLRHLNVPKCYYEKFWIKYSRRVESCLSSKRNDAATAVKNAFFNYLDEYMNSKNLSMRLEVVTKVPLALYEVDEWFSKSNYADFCNHFVRAVVGHRKFDQEKAEVPLSSFVTVSDEAFALLICENNKEKWLDMYEKGDRKKSDVAPKYTNGGNCSNTNAYAERCKGWSTKGTERYGALYHHVQQIRRQQAWKRFEAEYLETKKREYENERSLRKRKHCQPEKMHIEMPHSFYDHIPDTERKEESDEEEDNDDETDRDSHNDEIEEV